MSSGTVAFIRGAGFGAVFPFWAMLSLYVLQNGPNILFVQFFPSESGWIVAGCIYSRNSSYLLDVCHRLHFVAVGILFCAWSSGTAIDTVVFSALMVLGSQVLLM
jgi:hypothetical protein